MHRGEVVIRLEPDGREVARTQPGGVFGEMSLLTGDPRTATVAAATDSVVLEIDADALREVVLSRPDAIEAISRRSWNAASGSTPPRPRPGTTPA